MIGSLDIISSTMTIRSGPVPESSCQPIGLDLVRVNYVVWELCRREMEAFRVYDEDR